MTTFEQAGAKSARVADGLDELAGVLDREVGLPGGGAAKLRARAGQLRADGFRVLVLGEFKRGKSTFLNALLGRDVMPQKAAPCTAVVTLVRYGEQPAARVVFSDGREDEQLTIEGFRAKYELTVADTAEAAEAMGRFDAVEHAVISYPVELCRHRVELVDSPGLGEHRTRTERTQKFLPQADAVVLVLDATQLLSEEESHFIDAVLLPMNLRNIFFVVNKWNLIGDSALREEDADRDREELNQKLASRLGPLCTLGGRDRSAERIFRVNALGALKARMRPNPALLAESNVPAFEAALQEFLTTEKARARDEVALGAVRAAAAEAERFIGAQLANADKSLAEVEAEREAVQPKLERLRGIRKGILRFLQAQSATLQDRLISSLHEHVRKIERELPDEMKKFDLTPITRKWMIWEALVNWTRKDEDRLEQQVKNCVSPQVQKLLERRFAEWQIAVVRNEMQSVMIDVETHLLADAEEYQRVMAEVEDVIGYHGSPLKIKEQVDKWLGHTGVDHGVGPVVIGAGGVLGETIGWLVAGIATEVIAEVVLHVATGGVTLIISAVMAAVRAGMRESRMHGQLRQGIVEAIKKGLGDLGLKYTGSIRSEIKKAFDGLEEKVGGSIAEEIAIVDATLQAIIEKKQQREYTVGEDRQRLGAARAAVARVTERLTGDLVKL